MRPLLGTFVEITVADGLSIKKAHQALTLAFDAIEGIQDLLGFQNSSSELSKLNRANGLAVELTPLTLRVLNLAKRLSKASGGQFNCLVGGACMGIGVLPRNGLPDCLPVGSVDDLEIGQTTARLLKPVAVTLDGIAKGYAVDRAVKALRQAGVTSGLVNAGGDLRAFGEFAFPVAESDEQGGWRLLGNLKNAALATSSKRAYVDHRYPGWIVGASPECARGVHRCSVIAPWAWLADGLTKVALACSESERARVLQHLGGCLVATSQRQAVA